VICRIPLSPAQAVLGATLPVPTLRGRAEMKVAPGTQSGQIYRLRGQGFPDLGGPGEGDQIVVVNIEVPKKLSQQQEKLYRELAEIDQVNVTPERKGFLDMLKGMLNL
jgi:molecular chaperone DnaJ